MRSSASTPTSSDRGMRLLTPAYIRRQRRRDLPHGRGQGGQARGMMNRMRRRSRSRCITACRSRRCEDVQLQRSTARGINQNPEIRSPSRCPNKSCVIASRFGHRTRRSSHPSAGSSPADGEDAATSMASAPRHVQRRRERGRRVGLACPSCARRGDAGAAPGTRARHGRRSSRPRPASGRARPTSHRRPPACRPHPAGCTSAAADAAHRLRDTCSSCGKTPDAGEAAQPLAVTRH